MKAKPTRHRPQLPPRDVNKVVEDYRRIRKEYAYNPDIFCNEDPRAIAVKEIIDKRLTPADRTIFLLYTDCQSLRELGRMMGTSHMTIWKEIQRIRGVILQHYNATQQ